MSLRVRANGQMLCAAKHPTLPDDIRYIDDGLHYALGVEQGVLVADDDEDVSGKWHWRRKGERFKHLNFERDGYTDDPVNDYGYDIVFWGEDWEWLRDRGDRGAGTDKSLTYTLSTASNYPVVTVSSGDLAEGRGIEPRLE